MALSCWPHCSPCQNRLPVNPSNNELSNSSPRALTQSSDSLASNFCVFTSDLAPTPTLAPAISSINNKLFKQFMKAYLEAQIWFLAPALVPVFFPVEEKPWKQPFKTYFPKLYFGNLYMEYYNFCQQYDNYFETSRTIGFNKVSLAMLFLTNNGCSTNIIYCPSALNYWRESSSRLFYTKTLKTLKSFWMVSREK